MKQILLILVSYAIISCSQNDAIIDDGNGALEVNTKALNLQKIALEAIYNNNPNNTLNWDLTNPNIDNWDGVITNGIGEVIHLNLNSKNLDVLPPEIAYLPSVTTLYLNGNNLSAIPAQIGKLRSLEQLYVYNNELSDLPEQMKYLYELKDLYIGFNQFTQIPSVVGKIKSLEVLNASHNTINSIAGSIYKLPNLKILGLFKNNISNVSSYIKYLKSTLLELNLGRNNLTSVPKEIGSLGYLKKLYLNQNNLQSIPYEIGNLENAEFIDLRNNTSLNAVPVQVCDLNSARQKVVYLDNWLLCF